MESRESLTHAHVVVMEEIGQSTVGRRPRRDIGRSAISNGGAGIVAIRFLPDRNAAAEVLQSGIPTRRQLIRAGCSGAQLWTPSNYLELEPLVDEQPSTVDRPRPNAGR
jgi:hypothetical protein